MHSQALFRGHSSAQLTRLVQPSRTCQWLMNRSSVSFCMLRRSRTRAHTSHNDNDTAQHRYPQTPGPKLRVVSLVSISSLYPLISLLWWHHCPLYHLTMLDRSQMFTAHSSIIVRTGCSMACLKSCHTSVLTSTVQYVHLRRE
jgi:hypothetical protein